MSQAGTSANTADANLTRSAAAQSREIWKKCNDLVARYHEDLETWLIDRPVANFTALTDALRGDLEDRDTLWRVRDALQTVKQDLLTHRQKISNIEKITNQLDAEILNAPSGVNPADTDTCTTRQLHVIQLRNKLQEVNDVYNASEARYKRHKSDYNHVADDNGVPVKQEPPSRRPRQRQDQSPGGFGHSLSDFSDWDAPDTQGRYLPRPKQQVDAKALKPQVLETSMPSTSLKEWFVVWDNYKEAS